MRWKGLVIHEFFGKMLHLESEVEAETEKEALEALEDFYTLELGADKDSLSISVSLINKERTVDEKNK